LIVVSDNKLPTFQMEVFCCRVLTQAACTIRYGQSQTRIQYNTPLLVLGDIRIQHKTKIKYNPAAHSMIPAQMTHTKHGEL